MTLGKSFVVINYTITEDKEIYNNDIIKDKDQEIIINNDIINKNKTFLNNKDLIEKPKRNSLPTFQVKKIVPKNHQNNLGENKLIDSYQFQKYKNKDGIKALSNNLFPKKEENILATNSIGSLKDISKKIIKDKKYPIAYKDEEIKIENIKLENNIKLDGSFEIINSIEINNLFNIFSQKETKIYEKLKIYDTFCIGMFISGLSPPIKISSILENSENFLAPCGHPQCSLFPSIQADILNSYMNKKFKDSNIISSLVSNMCFPLGIKPCFGCKFDENHNIENVPNPQKTFYNVLINEKNELYYMATLHYFIKLTNSEYIQKYKFNPITHYLEKNGGLSNNNKDKKFKDNMKMISSSLNNNNVFVPESITLISKYPLFTSMEKCLKCMITLQNDDLNNLINHLINEVPAPKKCYQVQFFIPIIKEPIVLNHEYNKFLEYLHKDKNNNPFNDTILSQSQINLKILIDKISVENIIMLFQLMLMEQKILLLENNYKILSEIAFILLELIYPLTWSNSFLPVLSNKTVKFMQSPVPYIMGLDEYLLKYSYDSKYIYQGSDMIIFNIMTNQFISHKTKKRIHKKEIFHEFKLPTIPDKIGDSLYKELKNIKKIIEKNEKNKGKKDKFDLEIIPDDEIDKKIRMAFLKTMIMLIGDYNNYLFYTEDELPLFNREAFVQSHNEKNEKIFLSEFVKTQIFNQFLLNERQLYKKTKDKIKDLTNNGKNKFSFEKRDSNKINYELIDTSYFKKFISVNTDLLNSEKMRKRALSSKKLRGGNKNLDSQRNPNLIYPIFNNDDINKNDNNNALYYGSNGIEYIQESNKSKEVDGNGLMSGNHSIDYIRGKKENNNTNMSEYIVQKDKYNEENNVEDINTFEEKRKKSIIRNKSAKKIIGLKYNTGNLVKKDENKIFFGNVKKIMLYPYFLSKNINFNINNITINSIINDIKLYLQKRKFNYQSQDKEHIFIISKRHGYIFNNIEQRRMYLLPNNKTDNLISNINNIKIEIEKNLEEEKNNYIKDNKYNTIGPNINSNDLYDSLKSIDKNSDDIKFIKKCFISCYTNKARISKEQLNTLRGLLENSDNKLFFATLILPDTKLKKNKNHKQLTSSSFDDLGRILSLALQYINSNELNSCRLLTLSCFVYYKIENKKIIYLYENIICGLTPCVLWQKDTFWEYFFKSEYEEEKQNINLQKFNFNGSINYLVDIDKNLSEANNDQILYSTTIFMAKIMLKLKLSKKMTVTVFKQILEKYEKNPNKINYFINEIKNLFDKF